MTNVALLMKCRKSFYHNVHPWLILRQRYGCADTVVTLCDTVLL